MVSRSLAASRTEAQRLITGGSVTVDGETITKANKRLPDACVVAVSANALDAYVSRGGNKLAAALTDFNIDPKGCECLDIGISTGGFTDCLLQHGAVRVIGIDVGHGQLHPRLADDPRIELREGINARLITREDFPICFSLITVDVSFISLTYVLPQLRQLLTPAGDLICLIKPQFEVGFGNLGKNGVVVDASQRWQACSKVHLCAAQVGLSVISSIVSPIVGGEGNIEFLSHFKITQK